MASMLKQLMPVAYKKVARSVCFALYLGDASSWDGGTSVLKSRLSEEERGALAWAVLRAMDAENAAAVAHTVLPDRAGMPVFPLFDVMDQACNWADIAAPSELDSYCLATFNRMSPHRQAAFLDFVQGRQAA